MLSLEYKSIYHYTVWVGTNLPARYTVWLYIQSHSIGVYVQGSASVDDEHAVVVSRPLYGRLLRIRSDFFPLLRAAPERILHVRQIGQLRFQPAIVSTRFARRKHSFDSFFALASKRFSAFLPRAADPNGESHEGDEGDSPLPR